MAPIGNPLDLCWFAILTGGRSLAHPLSNSVVRDSERRTDNPFDDLMGNILGFSAENKCIIGRVMGV
jgi:hypothetical protein